MSIYSSISSLKYVIVSPVKDEERFVQFTLQSVTGQTLKPVLWLIVDDGSRDKTPEIVSNYIEFHQFIRLVRNPRAGLRQTGSAVIRAFNFGFESIRDTAYDFIVKLDCDLSFEPDYFEKIFKRFIADPKLGIASGIYLEQDRTGAWKPVTMPAYHAAGACKVIRRECFEDIGRFIVAAGWDTVDEIRAKSCGWKTGHVQDLCMKHHKPEGSGIGFIKTSIMHGEIYYLTGGSRLFFLFKVLHRVSAKPYVLRALALLVGYMRALFRQKVPLVTKKEAQCYQALLNERLWMKIKSLFVLS